MATLGPMLKQLSESVNSSIAAVSTLIAIKSIGYFIGTIGGGRVFDRFKGHKIMMVCIGGMALMMALIPLARTIIVLGIIMFFLGLFEGFVDVGGNTMTMWFFHGNLAPFMNTLHLCFGLGAFLSPIIIANFIDVENSLRWTYWTMALLFLLSIIGFARLPSPEPLKIAEDKKSKQQNFPIIALLAFLFFAYVGAELTFGNWIFTYAFESGLATEVTATYLNSTFWGAFALGRLISIPVGKKLSPEQILVIDMLGSIVSIGAIVVAQSNPVILWVASITLGLFMASTFPTLLIYAEKRFHITGSLTSWFVGSAGAASVIIPYIMTNLYKVHGIKMVPYTLFIVMFLAVVILFVMLLVARQIHDQQNQS